MKKHAKWYAAASTVALVTLLWPGPAASADTSLGGYDATATSSVVRIQVFEPVIPIPTASADDAQLDMNVSFARAMANSGSSAATASYFWPGDAVALGLGLMMGQPDFQYPVQVNAKYPATADAPANQAQQIGDGTGMAASTDGDTTKATVSAFGIGPTASSSGSSSNPLGGLLGGSKTSTTDPSKTTVPTPDVLGGLVSVHNGTSTSTVDVADKSVTTRAYSAASSISLLAGLIKIEGLAVDSKVTSDGNKAVASGNASIGAITIAGMRFALGDKISLGSDGTQLPNFGTVTNGILKLFGLSFDTPTVTKKVDGATGQIESSLLRLTIDTRPIKKLINQPLSALVNLLGSQAATQLAPLVEFAPKIVLTFGDSIVSTTAAPPFDMGGDGGGGDSGTDLGGMAPTIGGAGVDNANAASDLGGSTGDLGGSGGDIGAGDVAAPPPSGSTPSITPVQQASGFTLPALGSVPRLLILGGLLLAAILGWALRVMGGGLLWGTANCDFGLVTGVPDLRRG